jgi:hypothetical protein
MDEKHLTFFSMDEPINYIFLDEVCKKKNKRLRLCIG